MSEELKEENKKENSLEEAKEEKPITLEKINELLTNSLKWSQIIYEQNRKINRKLFWYSFFNYLKFALILIPLIVGFFYLLPNVDGLLQTMNFFSGDISQKNTTDQEVLIENFLEKLPLDQSKKEQVKSLLR